MKNFLKLILWFCLLLIITLLIVNFNNSGITATFLYELTKMIFTDMIVLVLVISVVYYTIVAINSKYQYKKREHKRKKKYNRNIKRDDVIVAINKFTQRDGITINRAQEGIVVNIEELTDTYTIFWLSGITCTVGGKNIKSINERSY